MSRSNAQNLSMPTWHAKPANWGQPARVFAAYGRFHLNKDRALRPEPPPRKPEPPGPAGKEIAYGLATAAYGPRLWPFQRWETPSMAHRLRAALRTVTLILAGSLLAGCAEVNYERTTPGKLKGKLILEWIDQDKFRFISDGTAPLRFIRANNEVIQPGPMYTDGGSIPAALRAIKSFSPWGYAPAFIIHDWLFVMKQCKLPGHDQWDHLKAAEVFSEVMKTVMENPKFGGPKPLIHYSMYEAVRSDVAKQYWDEGACETPDGTKRSAGTVTAMAPDNAPGATRGVAPAEPKMMRERAAAAPVRLRTVIEF